MKPPACAETGYQARWWGGDPWRACLQCGVPYDKHPPASTQGRLL